MQHYQQRTSGRAIKPACAYPSRCIVGYLCGQQEPRHSSPHSNSTVDLHAFYTAHSAWGGVKLCKSIPDIDFLVHIKMCIRIIKKLAYRISIQHKRAFLLHPAEQKKKGMGALRHQFEWHACPEISHEIKTAYKVFFFFLFKSTTTISHRFIGWNTIQFTNRLQLFFRKCNHKPCSG